MRSMPLVGVVASLVVVVTTSCSRDVPGRHHPPLLALTPCHLERLAEEVLCGTHEVFEDRDSGSGRRLSIHLAVMPALRRTIEPDPLFILAGGPGQGARGFAAVAARYFKTIRRTREIVLVDLRGTGASGSLDCPRDDDEMALVTGFFLDTTAVTRCRERLTADPRHYTHANALADLDEIRERLGYARINLWGGSWGTRAALLYAMTYPHAVRSVVLDGAVSMSMEFPRTVAHDADRAFERLLSACERDPACREAHANARGEFAALLASLDDGSKTAVDPARSPARVTSTRDIRHPRTGVPTPVTLSRDAVAEIIRVALYTPADAARVLQIIEHAAAGDFGPLVAEAVRSASWSTDDMAIGQSMSVLCSEDLPLVADVDFAREAAGTFLRSSYADAWRRRCQQWPRGEGLVIERHATSIAPALILSGAHDPVTGPDAGEAMAQHFPNHHHIVVQGAAHNTSFSGCVPDLIAAFITRRSIGPLDDGCATRIGWPPAVVSDAGTTP
jgi:pimeloyl-ACP methyl ester carboxylesterase